MARLPDNYNFGDIKDLTPDVFLTVMQRFYTDLAVAINSKPDLYQRTTDGQVSDTFLAQGAININTATNKVEMITNHPTATTVIWTQLS